MPERIAGKVKWWDGKKGYGYITGGDGKDYFCHWTNIESEHRFKKLGKDWEVIFFPTKSEKGLEAKGIVTTKVVYDMQETNKKED